MEAVVSIDPARVVLDPSRIVPTDVDCLAVQGDLNFYVMETRVISDALPSIAIDGGTAVALNGIPFIEAARCSEPALQSIWCRASIDSDEGVRTSGARVVPLSQVALLHDELLVRSYVEIIFFLERISSALRVTVEERILGYYHMVTADPRGYGGALSSLSEFEWVDGGRAIKWEWCRNSGPGRHLPLLIRVMTEISEGLSRVSSWNGIARIPGRVQDLVVPDELH